MVEPLGPFWKDVMRYEDKIQDERFRMKFKGLVDMSEPLDNEPAIALEAIAERSQQTKITEDYFKNIGFVKFKDLQEALFLERMPDGKWNHYAIGDVTLLPVYHDGKKVPSLHLAAYVLDGWKPRKADEFSPIAYFNKGIFYGPFLREIERQKELQKKLAGFGRYDIPGKVWAILEGR